MSSRTVTIPSAGTIAAAHAVVREALTPTLLVDASELAPALHLKLECLQPTGSFKVRGAAAAIAAAPAGAMLVTASAGNHALAMAWAAARAGRELAIYVAETASPAKLAGLERAGADVRRVGTSFDDAEAAALAFAAQGHHFVSPYNDGTVIAGASSLGPELEPLLAEHGGSVVVPVGGGGLLAGLALWAAERPDVRLYGVEPAASAAFGAAVSAGHVVAVPIGATLSDGTAGGIEDGAITVDIVGARANGMRTVTEPEIATAMQQLVARQGIVAEGAGALAVAAVLAGRIPAGPGPVVALVTGRNVALPRLGEVLGAAA